MKYLLAPFVGVLIIMAIVIAIAGPVWLLGATVGHLWPSLMTEFCSDGCEWGDYFIVGYFIFMGLMAIGIITALGAALIKGTE